VVAAVTELLSSGLGEGALVATAAVWVLLASAGVAAPLLVQLRGADRAAGTYASWRSWIVARSRAILYGVGGLVCVVLVVKGVVGLIG
jgi:hypothetical protein